MSPLPRWERARVTLPFLRQQKGDASSEARRRRFIRPPRAIPSFLRRQESRGAREAAMSLALDGRGLEPAPDLIRG